MEQNSEKNFKIDTKLLPKFVYVADKPLSDNPVIKKLPLKQFEDMISKESGVPFHWAEQMFAQKESADLSQFFISEPDDSKYFQQIKDFFEESEAMGVDYTNLVICNVGEGLGRGIYTKTRISKNTLIGFYAGKISTFGKVGNDENINAYRVSFETTDNHGLRFAADGQVYGNMSRFINDFPAREELKHYQFAPEVAQDEILTANVLGKTIFYKNVPYMLIIANRDINAGEQLGTSYGIEFWKLQERFCGTRLERRFFNKKSQLLSRDSCVPRLLFIHNKIFSQHYEPPTIISMLKNEIIPTMVTDSSEQFDWSRTELIELLNREYTKSQRKLYFYFDPCDADDFNAFIKLHSSKEFKLQDTQNLHPLYNKIKLWAEKDNVAKMICYLSYYSISFNQLLTLACEKNHFAILEALCSFAKGLQLVFNIDAQTIDERKTALHFSMGSCQKINDFKLVHLLLANGADATIQDMNQQTIFHYAANINDKELRIQALKILLNHLNKCGDETKDKINHLPDIHGKTFKDYLTDSEKESLNISSAGSVRFGM